MNNTNLKYDGLWYKKQLDKKYYDWNGSILVGSLKYMYLERLVLDQNNNVKYREKVAENIGRVRDVKISPDGFIYLAVDNKGIFKIVP